MGTGWERISATLNAPFRAVARHHTRNAAPKLGPSTGTTTREVRKQPPLFAQSRGEARWLALSAKALPSPLELGNRAAAARRCRGDRLRAGRAGIRTPVAGHAATVGTAAARRSTVQRGDEAARWAEARCRSQEWWTMFPDAWARRSARSAGCPRASTPELQRQECLSPVPACRRALARAHRAGPPTPGAAWLSCSGPFMSP